MELVAIEHRADEELELYALGRLPATLEAEVEEHLLVCDVCQERLNDLEAYALAMRQAIAAAPDAPAAKPRAAWLAFARLSPIPVLSWAGMLALILIGAALYFRPAPDVPPLAAIQLTALRGDNIASVEPALETDLTFSDAPAAPALRAEVVDAAGGAVWSGAFPANTRKIQLTKRLAPGRYFVRLYDPAGQLLHEYAFRCAPPSNR